MDLTSLNEDDTKTSIETLISQSNNALGNVAAICIYAKFLSFAKARLNPTIGLATVANFPSGDANTDAVIAEVKAAIENGADEVDIVIPYKEYLKNGSCDYASEMVKAVKAICGNKTLKVIIESGELKHPDLIAKAARDAIENGADFIKTSTGKTATGATLEAARVMLDEIKKSKKTVGFKASGGIRNYEDACAYITLATDIMGEGFIDARTFRFGVSGLLKNLLDGTEVTTKY